jgi:hypothetical protein
MQHIIEALVKDIAEQLRPMVAEMVRSELASVHTEKDVSVIAAAIDLEELAKNINLADLAGELTDSQLTEIAGDIDLSDLADEFDGEKLAEHVDLDSALTEWFSNQSFTIRP